MLLNLNNRKLTQTGLAGLMIYIGVILKNGGEQIGMKKHPLSSIIGPIVFTLGWAFMAYSISPIPKLNIKCILSYLGALCVVASVMSMKMFKLNVVQKGLFEKIFVLGWFATTIAIGLGKPLISKQLSMFALVNVLSSMLYILPKQRELCLVDGIGMTMFAITFVSLALANSL